MGFSESDTRVKLIDPKLKKSEWDESKIIREHVVTDGKIIDAKGNRNPGRFADYNHSRIHSYLGYLTPDEFARS